MKLYAKIVTGILAAAVLAAGGTLGWYALHPELQAKYTLHRFLRACAQGSEKRILRYCAIAQTAPFWDTYDADGNEVPVDLQQTAADAAAEIQEEYGGIGQYQMTACYPFAKYIVQLPDAIRADQADLERKRIGLFSKNYLAYLDGVTDSCLIMIQYDGEDEPENKFFIVNRTGHKWMTDLLSLESVYLLDLDEKDFDNT